MSSRKSNPSTAAIAPLRVGIPEAARILGVSRSRIYLRIREGSLAAVKEGGRTLIAVSEINAYVARTNAVGGVRTTHSP
jgi:excisionase family DNA binding protein